MYISGVFSLAQTLPKGFPKESRRGVGGRVILANEERSEEYRFGVLQARRAAGLGARKGGRQARPRR